MPTMTLKSPANGTSISVTTFTKTRKTLGQDMSQVRPSTWPTKDVMSWKFEGIKRTDLDTLLQYLIDNNGKKVTITTPHGESWEGYVVSDRVMFRAMQANTPKNCRLYVCEFKFEGVQV